MAEVAALRAFNRLYTRRLGLLNARLDGSPFALTEARVLYELAHSPGCIAADIGRTLGLDRAQLSRILKRFEHLGLLAAQPAGRTRVLQLTRAGLAAFDQVQRNTEAAVGRLLAHLAPPARARLIAGATIMGEALSDRGEAPAVFRDLELGDLGWIARRQAQLYAEEYGFDISYEAVAAEILAAFVKERDPAREQAWIAELRGEIAGSIFLMQETDPEVGRLRLLYVEPWARGAGLGARLVDACVERASAVGYRRLVLWTQSILEPARRIYQAAGFRLGEAAPNRAFGRDLVSETWTLEL
jgi:DNA-binding MarR family transcriptional regulator